MTKVFLRFLVFDLLFALVGIKCSLFKYFFYFIQSKDK